MKKKQPNNQNSFGNIVVGLVCLLLLFEGAKGALTHVTGHANSEARVSQKASSKKAASESKAKAASEHKKAVAASKAKAVSEHKKAVAESKAKAASEHKKAIAASKAKAKAKAASEHKKAIAESKAKAKAKAKKHAKKGRDLTAKTTNYGSPTLKTPTEAMARRVLTPSVTKQIHGSITYNGAGAFYVNHNHATVNANISSAPYATNKLDHLGRASVGNAWLNITTRQYRSRYATGNGASSWRPDGFEQAMHLAGRFKHAYDRGHLLGYALVGGISSFDASESNPDNIATQTAWANEAHSMTSTGQNYYEGIVRRALDQHKQVRYRVQDIYAHSNVVPAGAWIQAKSKDGSINFNVFVPNVQQNILINYATGAVTVR